MVIQRHLPRCDEQQASMPTVAILPLPEIRRPGTPWSTGRDERQRLLARIAHHQRACSTYLAATRPRSVAWTYTNIASSVVAAAAAAGPAAGGSTFTSDIQSGLSLPDDSFVYQVLCAIAFAMSMAAVITANVIRARDYASRIAAAEACHGELDALHVQLQFGALTIAHGAELVAKEIARVPFVAETDTPARGVNSGTLAA